jgi:hypothetical protein
MAGKKEKNIKERKLSGLLRVFTLTGGLVNLVTLVLTFKSPGNTAIWKNMVCQWCFRILPICYFFFNSSVVSVFNSEPQDI